MQEIFLYNGFSYTTVFFLYCIGDFLIQSGVKTILKKLKLNELFGNTDGPFRRHAKWN